MPPSATEVTARAVPTDLVKAIVGDNYRRAAPTPPVPKGLVESLVENSSPDGLRRDSSKIGQSATRSLVCYYGQINWTAKYKCRKSTINETPVLMAIRIPTTGYFLYNEKS